MTLAVPISLKRVLIMEFVNLVALPVGVYVGILFVKIANNLKLNS